jgi:hypothetical protein
MLEDERVKVNEICLTFGVWGFTDVTHQDISGMLNLEPVKVHVLGERINPRILPVAKENGWMYTHSGNVSDSFEMKMDNLLAVLKSKKDILSELSSKYYCEISCAVFIKNEDESTPWIHLNNSHINFLNECNVEFDLDLYA